MKCQVLPSDIQNTGSHMQLVIVHARRQNMHNRHLPQLSVSLGSGAGGSGSQELLSCIWSKFNRSQVGLWKTLMIFSLSPLLWPVKIVWYFSPLYILNKYDVKYIASTGIIYSLVTGSNTSMKNISLTGEKITMQNSLIFHTPRKHLKMGWNPSSVHLQRDFCTPMVSQWSLTQVTRSLSSSLHLRGPRD